MSLHKFLPVIFTLIFTVNCLKMDKRDYILVTAYEYEQMPAKFELDNFDECFEKGQLFCKIYLKLRPNNLTHPSYVWRVIQITSRSFRYFRHDELLHGKCVERGRKYDVIQKLNSTYAHRFAENGLRVFVEDLSCIPGRYSKNFLVSAEDRLTLCITILYIFFIVYATVKKRTHKYIAIFSVKRSLIDTLIPQKGEDFVNLRAMQGIRVITIVNIIICHCFVANMVIFVSNPRYFEEFYSNPVRNFCVTSFSYMVQIFFLFSSWLLVVQFRNMYETNKGVTLRDVFLLAVNRYLRLIPAVVVVFFLHRHSVGPAMVQDIYKEWIHRETNRCFNYGWKNFLFIQNIFVPEEMCSPGTWYIAADTQLYILALVILYLRYRFNISIYYTITFVIGLTSYVQLSRYNAYDIDGFTRIRPKLVDVRRVFMAKEFIIAYIHPFSNVQTYMLGLIFGTVYFDLKNIRIFIRWYGKIFWYILFLGLPTAVIAFTTNEFGRGVENIIALVARPLFSFGIGMGVLGMATKMKSPIKTFLESEPMVFLANFTYSIYMFHFILVFLGKFAKQEMTELSDFILLQSVMYDILISVVAGIVMYLICEHPWGKVQKMLIPQPRKEKTPRKK